MYKLKQRVQNQVNTYSWTCELYHTNMGSKKLLSESVTTSFWYDTNYTILL